MANCYRMIQMTNNAIPAVAANELLPLGTVTRRVCPRSCGCQTFELSYTGADTVTINEAGYYRVAYTLSGAAGAAGVAEISLLAGGNTLYSASATATAEGDEVQITMVFMVRAFRNCDSLPANLPLAVQIKNAGVALTSAVGNLLIEKAY